MFNFVTKRLNVIFKVVTLLPSVFNLLGTTGRTVGYLLCSPIY